MSAVEATVRLGNKREAAAMLGVHPEHLMRMAREKKDFPRCIKLGDEKGSAVRFDLDEIADWVAARKAARATSELTASA